MPADTLVAGRYRLLRTLGRGGTAVVELAEDVELRRTVAVKLLADGLVDDGDVRRRFVREARLAAGLSHPNVVRVYDVGEHEGRPFFVMEHVDGETLADLVDREGPLAVFRAVDLLVQACAGIEAAHAAGLVHRDVKPQNLILRPDGVLKVVDFGIARREAGTRLTEVGTVLGSAAYMAPEQLDGGEVTVAADVYGLGAVLYELLTGRPPRPAETLAQLAVDEPITAPRDIVAAIPAPLERTIMRCLARSPGARPGSAATLAHELRRTTPETLPRSTTVARPRVAQRRRLPSPALPVALAALLAALAVGLALALTLGGRSPKPAAPARPAPVRPVPHSDDPAQEARNVAAWLRRHSR